MPAPASKSLRPGTPVNLFNIKPFRNIEGRVDLDFNEVFG